MTSRSAVAALATALVLVACAESPVAPVPTAELKAPSNFLAALSTGPARYIVTFRGDDVPSTFAANVANAGGRMGRVYPTIGVATVEDLSIAGAASLATAPGVEEIGADVALQFLNPSAPSLAASHHSHDPKIDPRQAFFYDMQWNLRQVGADIAWKRNKLGSRRVKVAIMDTGIDYLYPDLDGLVDLENSASFVPFDDGLVPLFFPGRNVVTDLNFHGTHVASIVSSNALVAAGVTAKTTLMAVKVLDVFGSGTLDAALAGLVFATDHGADVINMSFGDPSEPYDLRDRENREFFRRVVDRAFRYAYRRDVTVVVAAGNESQNLDIRRTYKPFCGSAHTICVSATGPTAAASDVGPWTNPDAFAPYSNFGRGKIDVAAPGGSDAAPVWGACSTTSLLIPDCQVGIFVIGVSGTSQATPHTSALAALLAAERHGRNSPDRIKEEIFRSAKDLGARGNDALFGHGRISVSRALDLR